YGNIIGALTFADHRVVSYPRMLDLVAFTARTIEERLRTSDKVVQAEVLQVFHHQLLKFPDSAILALDVQGRILALSPTLAKRASLTMPNRLIGRLLRDVRDFTVEGLDLPVTAESRAPAPSSLILPQRDKLASMVIPIPSRQGQQVGLIIMASEPSRALPVKKKVSPASWHSVYTFQHLIGSSATFQRALALAEQAAGHEWPILLVGESGTGKELFAQAIHSAGRRAAGPFVALNCSTIPKDLTASELFGYEAGAFSGALRGGKRGKIMLAHGGTLFLDELIDMPLETQAHLLRCLEEGHVVPLGSERPHAVDVRVIASMSLDPSAAVAQGRLRVDLYHRLNVCLLVLPSLRDRLEDLAVLARHLLEREGFTEIRVAPEVIELFRRYAWPGNIRELRNVLVRAAMVATDQVIRQEHLPPELTPGRTEVSGSPTAPPIRVKREQIVQALRECGGNKSHAAKRLGVHWMTLHRKMRLYGLTREHKE
ncbi:MAG: sigma-54 interaction domain-containing protein, partial [Candidatus Binatia bacterium]